jgi:hypothetical protein
MHAFTTFKCPRCGHSVTTQEFSIKKPIPKLRKASQPPLSHAGAIPDSERAKRPPLSQAFGTGLKLTHGDRVEALGNFGKPSGEFGTVERTNEDDAEVKWDNAGRVMVHQLHSRRFGQPARKTVQL